MPYRDAAESADIERLRAEIVDLEARRKQGALRLALAQREREEARRSAEERMEVERGVIRETARVDVARALEREELCRRQRDASRALAEAARSHVSDLKAEIAALLESNEAAVLHYKARIAAMAARLNDSEEDEREIERLESALEKVS